MISFREELADAVMDGSKVVTRRLVNLNNPRAHWHPDNAPKRYAPGTRHAVVPGRGKHGIGFVTIVSVEREMFNPQHITLPEARREGFPSALSFIETWIELHGECKPVDVWRVEMALNPSIRITFISDGVRSEAKVYPTDDAQEALSTEVAKWYRDSGTEHPGETALFSVLIERDHHRMEKGAVAKKLRDIAGMEEFRQVREWQRVEMADPSEERA